MSDQVQYRRGTEAQHASFKGAPGEMTVDTTNNRVRVHDGATPGGWPAAKLSDIPATSASLGTHAVTVSQDGQTSFSFPTAPTDLGDVGLLVNGIEYRAPDILISSTAVTWGGLFTIKQNYNVFLRYK